MSTGGPAKLGRYDIIELLGSGAMGVVYRAHDPGIERDVALKTIRPEMLAGEQGKAMLARFRNEAVTAGRLSHPGIVTVYEFGVDAGTAFIAMELAPGIGLSDYVQRRGGLSLDELKNLMGQLLDALHYAHTQGVVHRDIKPPNLLVSDAGRLKITDFGIARFQNSNLTGVGSMVGTPNHMAPEQFLGQEIDRRVDVFAAGVVLYELLIGAMPFTGDTIAAVAYQVCNVEPAPPTARNPHVPALFDSVIARALAKRKEERFASAREFAQALGTAPEDFVPITAPRMPSQPGMASSPLVASSPTRDTNPASTLPGAPAFAAPTPMPMPTSGAIPAAPSSWGSSSQLGPAPTSGSLTAASSWNPAILKALEEALTPAIGPIAKVLVKRAAAQTKDFDDLLARLGTSLGSDDERATFTKRAAAARPK